MILEKLKAFWKKATTKAYAAFAFVNGFLPYLILLNQEIREQQRSEEHFTRLPSSAQS
ncbi:hypothetical protein RE628_22370 [Paenibacillus sp. D2_2]|uniref:hypothetical protein n=1 Tax=Paenibacillus sp. D2_2 TaxID=3073092 RepID=UPI002815FCB7|nr:hypothetical protein [Paenibacillus sp. D2_2]WMT40043.1 hypothetical protein RE628_22370 [Paenibacillus sp. D2_2]